MVTFLYFILILLCCSVENTSTVTTKRPNIVFILADDLGWGDVSIHGSAQVKTPNIDLLATNGITLNNYYTSPICTPSRGALMTGYHPIHLGLQHRVINNEEPWGLPLNHKILPQFLESLGYETKIVGKWHLGFFRNEYLPTRRGFNEHFGYWTGNIDFYDKTSGRNKSKGYALIQNENPLNSTEYPQYLTDLLTEKAVEVIMKSEKSEKPLFLFVSQHAVHAGTNKTDPIQAPDHYINRFKHIKGPKRRKFCAMVSSLDDSVGQIYSALKKSNKLNQTILIFSTDNGGATGGTGGWSIDGSIGSNWPLRGAKYTLFEGGIRGFSFIWSPLLKKQYVSNHLMHIQDWLPTIYSAVGGPPQDLGPIDGIDMWDILNNNLNNPRKQLLHNIDDIWKVWALRDGDYKLISGSTKNGHFDQWYLPPGEHNSTEYQIDYQNSNAYNIMKQMDYKIRNVSAIYTDCGSNPKTKCNPQIVPCLFNIRVDPCEYNNLYDEKPEIVKQMLELLMAYNSTAVKPLIKEPDSNANPNNHGNFWAVWQ